MAGGVEYQVTKVDPTNPETKGMVYQVNSVSEEVAATLGGKVYRARIINNPTEPTVVGKVYQIVLIDDPDDPAVKGKVYNAILTGESEVVVIGPAVSPLALPDAIADSLHYVKAFGGTEQRNLPDGYTELEYIESSGTQYIDTGVYISTGYKVRVKAYATSLPTTSAFFGCTSVADASNAKKGIYRIIGGTINRCAWGDGSGSVVGSLSGNDSLNTWYDMVCDNGVWTINDTLFATCPESSFTSEYSMWLFARNTGGTVSLPASCRISVCQIWDNNGQMIRNFVPAKNSSNVVGMYDTVTGNFLTNAGTGDFTAGADVVPTPDAPMDIVSNNGVLKYGFNYYSYNVTRQLSEANYPAELDRSVSYSNGVLTCGITGSVSSNRGLYPTWEMYFTAGHKYACIVMAKGDSRINLGLATIIPSGSVTGGSSVDGFYTLTSNYAWYAKLWECNTNSSARLNIRVAGTDVGQYASFKDILVIDLTAIFGAGNEPTTSSDIIQRTVKIYTDGTVETINVRSQNLLKMPSGTVTASGITMVVDDGKATFTGSFSSNYFYGKISGASLAAESSANAIQGQTYASEPVIMKAGQTYKIYALSQPRTFYCTCADGTRDSITGSVQGADGYLTYTPVKDITALWVQYFSSDGLVSGTQSVYQLTEGSTEIPYAPYYDGGTATAEMLLKAGTYQDVQSIIDGVVTRSVGVLVFDGTEEFWRDQISNNSRVFIRNTDINCITVSGRYADYFCSHFLPTTTGSTPGSTAITATGMFFWVQSNITTLTEWTDWLAAQYTAGTPVIVVYPLATPTTESITGQTLQVTDGDNVLEITQASLSGLELEAEYEKEGA